MAESSDRKNLAPPLPRPTFREPLPGTWLYLGLTVDPRTLGPKVRRSAERTRVIARCHDLLDGLGVGDRGVLATATVLQTVLIPPLRGVPRFDVVVLARAEDGAGEDGAGLEDGGGPLAAIRAAFEADGVSVTETMTARNVRRFGDTEATQDATFLLNHFTAPDADDAQAVWEDISGWYAGVLGVDNSALLRPVSPAPYALVNYVRLAGAPVPFLRLPIAAEGPPGPWRRTRRGPPVPRRAGRVRRCRVRRRRRWAGTSRRTR
jgi:hypothetical protein